MEGVVHGDGKIVSATSATLGDSDRIAGLVTQGSAPFPVPKRVLDLVLSVLLLLALVPVVALVALAIKVDSPGPIFFRCRRVGYRGEELRMLKFRKMADGCGGPPLTTTDDARLTRCGRILAATKLDELPQLWHVLKGEMSLVGPRPEDPDFVAVHEPAYRQILEVKPGITGLSQLAFVREMKVLDPEDRIASYLTRLLPAKVQLDLLYVQSRSVWMDLRIIAWTAVAVVLRRDVAVDRTTGRLGLRRRSRRRFPAAGRSETSW